ncbi:hypothetical protein [Xanthobacter sp.]|uniref:hypothetical protein n=1 Tax=Xanthobacter sp. TaxID=35809 RepID=UPI0025F41E01|nr:hypothetical protein [Xanthobacter sp.]
MFVALPQASAFAEVCDKMAPSGQFGLVAAVTLALVCALAWYVRNAWVSALCAFICVLLAIVAVLDLSQDHPVYRSAVIEGCRSRGGDMFEAFVLLAGAAFILASGWMRRRKTS